MIERICINAREKGRFVEWHTAGIHLRQRFPKMFAVVLARTSSSVAHISDLFLYFGARIIYQTPLYVPDKDREWKAGPVPEIAPHQV